MLLHKVCLALAAGANIAQAVDPRLFHGLKLTRDETNDLGLVTWDEHSLFVRGERVIFFSGEFHPFRLPVPGLWRDVFEKIRAMGYNGVSFYVDWALLEGTPGVFRAEGVFDLEPFFTAAKEVGIYLLARPGSYINAEVSGGGFPGWQQRNPATLRTTDPGFLNSTDLYMSSVGRIIADAQITNGGPIILVQPENEYSQGPTFPQPEYMGYVEQQLRNAGVVVPLMNNQASPDGHFATGQPDAVDIYGYDAYPLGFNCGNPSDWGTGSLPTSYQSTHIQQSPTTPHSIVEFQGGSFDPWGGVGYENCAALLNYQFESVFYKNDFSQGVKMLNLYMTFGGTNWGNLGHDSGYTSYDYGAVIAEDRTVTRQKYSEAKLIANALRASPSFLTAVAQSNSNGAGAYTGNNNVFVTGVYANTTNFYFARQNEYYSTDSISYSLTIPTSQGNITIPQLGTEQLALYGRESKMHVSDYDLGGINLLYSSAEIFTWQMLGLKRTLILYGDDGQTHEFAVSNGGQASQIQGSGATIANKNSSTVVNTKISSSRQIIQFSEGLNVHIVDRASAYNYWVINHQGTESSGLPIVHMGSGYLVRDIELNGDSVKITADLNGTSPVEVIGAPSTVSSILLNGEALGWSYESRTGILSATAIYKEPQIDLPDLSRLTWHSINSIPETRSDYDDSLWTKCDIGYTNNTNRPLSTPKTLYSGDYGYNTGSLLYRGRFIATGNETQFQLSPQGGYGFGYTVWLNENYLGSWAGSGSNYYHYDTFDLPTLDVGAEYIFTVLIDHMGNSENWEAGADGMKQPRGVMQYVLQNREMDAITWKMTGNLGGENYVDLARGPLNEGAPYAQRQGYHLPGAPTNGKGWTTDLTPHNGWDHYPGVQMFTTTFKLDLPQGYDIPLHLDFGANSIDTDGRPVRVSMFVNGYQFGKYVSNVGPQVSYPVPEGIWNYQGSNTLAIELWAVSNQGASVPGLSLKAGHVIQWAYGSVEASPQPGWTKRSSAY